MEEEFDDSGLDKYSKERYQEGVAALLEEKELKIKWRKEIAENDSIQDYFKGFHPNSVETFINHYLIKKYYAHKHSSFYESEVEKKRTGWIDEATNHLECILQKKLFDLQCLWRADQITLKSIDIAFDFLIWEKDIFNCPFLEAISTADIKMYQDFLNSGEADRFSHYYREWQDYRKIKKAYHDADAENCEMFEWYEFHNIRTGSNSMLLLPDTRGEKEDFYKKLFYKNKNKELKQNGVNSNYSLEKRPYLLGEEKDMIFFSSTFEDAENRIKLKNFFDYNHESSNRRSVDELVRKMENVNEYIPIESHYDFREAITIAYDKYYLRKVVEHLPIAHKQYLFNKSMNISLSRTEEDDFYINMRGFHYNQILDGRELNGEPRDLNF